jgi:peptidoglycan hydrolase CwlO-like protein
MTEALANTPGAEAAISKMENDLSATTATVHKEVPFPETTPRPVDMELLDILREKRDTFTNDIKDLDKAIADMQSRRDEYRRAVKRIDAAIDVQIDSKFLDSA